jgi:hypothetical protein
VHDALCMHAGVHLRGQRKRVEWMSQLSADTVARERAVVYRVSRITCTHTRRSAAARASKQGRHGGHREAVPQQAAVHGAAPRVQPVSSSPVSA